jgi:hypothetical protein
VLKRLLTDAAGAVKMRHEAPTDGETSPLVSPGPSSPPKLALAPSDLPNNWRVTWGVTMLLVSGCEGLVTSIVTGALT